MRIENALYRIDIEPKHGTILQIRDKVGRLNLITEPRLADSFRILLPLPTMQANYLIGGEQELAALEKLPNGAKLHWAGPLKNAHGAFDLSVTLWIEFLDDAIQFRCAVQNRSEHQVAEVWYPVLGGMTGLGKAGERKLTKVLVPHHYSQWTRDLFSTFGSGECLGVFGGEHGFIYPARMPMPWASMYSAKRERGVYFACHDRVSRSKILRFGMVPGTAFGRVDGDWPTAKEAGGLPVGVTMSWAMLPYTKPGEDFQGPPVTLQCHAGDWREAAKLYRGWFDANFGVVDSRHDWMRQQTASLDLMFMLPEDNINLTYKKIPQWAKTALDRGIKSVLISGWQVGGHDRGYPFYEPEPRLGTWQELEAGIRACHELGVRVFFFVNVQPVDQTTEWYRKELHRYRTRDPWGQGHGKMAFGMGTLSARLGLTHVPMVSTNPCLPEVRRIFVQQMRKLAEIGADGVHIDKFFGQALDFNPRLSTSPDRASWEGMLTCVEEMLEQCRAVNPEFTFSYEGWFDRLMSYSDVVWWAPEHSVIKTTFPEWVPHVSVSQPYAFNVVNLAVVRGQNLLVGPANYQAPMDYAPMRELSEYIGEVTRIRNDLLGTVSRGEVLGASDPLFRADRRVLRMAGPFAKSPHAQWTVFRDATTGRRAAVLVNLGRDPLKVTNVRLSGKAGGSCRIYQPFRSPRKTEFPVTLTIPAERVAFVVEE